MSKTIQQDYVPSPYLSLDIPFRYARMKRNVGRKAKEPRMGLSDNERLTKIYYAVSGLVKSGINLNEHLADEYFEDRKLLTQLYNYTTQLWHAFLGGNSNSLHWLMGSDASSIIPFEASGPWSRAIQNTILSVAEKHDPGILILDEKKEFDAKEWNSVSKSLKSPHSDVFEIYLWNQNLSYALRRYTDEFRAGLEPLDKLVSNISGTCFSIFMNNDLYAKAYLLERISELLFSQKYPYSKDKIDLLFNKYCMHHKFHQFLKLPLAEIMAIHIYITTNPEDRLLVCAKYCILEKAFEEDARKFLKGDKLKQFNELLKTPPKKEEKEEEKDNPELEVYGYFNIENLELPNMLNAPVETVPKNKKKTKKHRHSRKEK